VRTRPIALDRARRLVARYIPADADLVAELRLARRADALRQAGYAEGGPVAPDGVVEAAAARPRPPSRDQFELDTRNKYEYAANWLDILRQLPWVRSYCYSRSWRVPRIAPPAGTDGRP
jgi:hypothetical protein